MTWRKRDIHIAQALRRTKWREIWNRMLALSDHHRTFRYSVLLGALNAWRRDQDSQPHCPLDGCAGTQRDTVEHVLWHCGAAQRVWRMLLGA